MKKILILDDDKDLSKVLADILDMEGYKTKIYHTIENILLAAESFKPDLIFLDYFLPGTNGDKVLSQLRLHPATQNIPVIMISGHPDGKDLAQKAGAINFLPKPFEIEILLSTVKKALYENRSQRSTYQRK